MKLQQLRYAIALAESASINAVAHRLFISQSSISVAIKELEQELGIKIFKRSTRGITLTGDGIEFISYARQIIEQVDMLHDHYSAPLQPRSQLSVVSQHYAFVVKAFTEFIADHDTDNYQFSLRETRTVDILKDVRSFKSDLGILYLSRQNEHALRRRMAEFDLEFNSLFHARLHVFVREGHPLTKLDLVHIKDLEGFPRYTFEQGPESSFYFSEEPLATLPHARQIIASDRATMTKLLKSYDGFLISSGVRFDETYSGIAAVPLDTNEVMNIGYIVHKERKLSVFAQGFLARLKTVIDDFS